MRLDLTVQEEAEIWLEAEQQCPPAISLDRLETIYTVPASLGSGYLRKIELSSDLELCIYHETYNDLTIRESENQHLIQFMVSLSGVIDTSNSIVINAEQSYVGGSGLQRGYRVSMFRTQTQTGVNIHMKPHLLHQLFATPTKELPAELQPLIRENDWHQVYTTKTTGAMRSVVQQIMDCSLIGLTRQLYLQGKVFELMALQLDGILGNETATPSDSLKADTIARIHYAAEILRSRLECPPSQTELAQWVGVSDRTLRRGFQALFHTTVLGYITEQRLLQAEQLLRHGFTVAEVVHRCGYSNQGHFAAVFKRKFGITPKQCAMGQKSAYP